jgi:hypothetical protein
MIVDGAREIEGETAVWVRMTGTAARLVAVACLLIALGPARVHSEPEAGSANAIMPGCEQTSRSRVQGVQIIGVQSVVYRATEPPPLGLRIRRTKEKDAS